MPYRRKEDKAAQMRRYRRRKKAEHELLRQELKKANPDIPTLRELVLSKEELTMLTKGEIEALERGDLKPADWERLLGTSRTKKSRSKATMRAIN